MTTKEFSNIILQYQRLILTICYQFVKDRSIAEDLTQETFISAYIHIDTCPMSAIKPWLARIATNKAKDYLKSEYNRRVIASEAPTDSMSYQQIVSATKRPDDIFISQEGVNQIREEIYALKEPYLKVSVMFFLEEKTVEEISTILNRPSKTVHTQLGRAKNILKEKLKERG